MKRHKNNRRGLEETDRDKSEDLRGELRKLVKENENLRKEVKRLRKDNSRLMGRDLQIQDFIEEIELEKELPPDIQKNACPKCGSKDVRVVEKLRNDTDYYFCNNYACGARGPIK